LNLMFLRAERKALCRSWGTCYPH